MLCGCGCVAAPEACGCRPGQRVFVCVVLALHGAFDVVEDARGSKRCAHVGVVHVEVSSVGLFARSALRVRPGSNDDRVLGNRLAGALIYPVRVGNARLNGRGGFLVYVFFLTLRLFLVESVYVLGGFNPFGDARQVEVSAVVLLGGVVPFLLAQEVFTQERERVVVEVAVLDLPGVVNEPRAIYLVLAAEEVQALSAAVVSGVENDGGVGDVIGVCQRE